MALLGFAPDIDAGEDPTTYYNQLQQGSALIHPMVPGQAPFGLTPPPPAPPKLVAAIRMPDDSVAYGGPGDIHADVSNQVGYYPTSRDDVGFAVPGGPFMSRDDALDWLGSSNPSVTSALTKSGPARPWGKLEANDLNRASSAVEDPPLEGMPTTANIPGVGTVNVGPFAPARKAAADYMATVPWAYNPPTQYRSVDPEFASQVAQAYEEMPHAPNDPEVKSAYDALNRETLAQYQFIKKTGLDIDFIKPGMEDPYAASPRLAQMDIANNNHWWLYPTEAGFGPDTPDQHPLLEDSGETLKGQPLLNNDVFRIVHDYFGHMKEGVGFRATGEENAYQSHKAMYSPNAQKAMASETRGQNSNVNFGPNGEFNRNANSEDTKYAQQKAGILPDWARGNPEDMPEPGSFEPVSGAPGQASSSLLTPAPLGLTTPQPPAIRAVPFGLAPGFSEFGFEPRADEMGRISRWARLGMDPEQIIQRLGEVSKGAPPSDYVPSPFNTPIGQNDYRISTRFPTGKEGVTEDPTLEHLKIGLSEMASQPSFEQNMNLIPTYPGFRKLAGQDPLSIAHGYINQATGNLLHLWNRLPSVMQQRSPAWYDGARNVSDALASRWGIARRSVSAAIAALSPQKDWFQNASLAERTGDILFGKTASSTMTPEMLNWAKSATKSGGDDPLFSTSDLNHIKSISGTPLNQLSSSDQALWVRAYDEAYNPRSYREITPEGQFGPVSLAGNGGPEKIGWGSFGEIERAVTLLKSGGDMNEISRTLPATHKVRSFYNNIEVPDDTRFGDNTIDTHAVGAGQLRSVSNIDPAVAHNFGLAPPLAKRPSWYRPVGKAGSSASGVIGTYGLLADAHRDMGAILGLLPRQVQSPTWEGIRMRFPADLKKAGGLSAEGPDQIWHAYDRGEIPLDQARDMIVPYGSIQPPGWASSGYTSVDPRRISTYR